MKEVLLEGKKFEIYITKRTANCWSCSRRSGVKNIAKGEKRFKSKTVGSVKHVSCGFKSLKDYSRVIERYRREYTNMDEELKSDLDKIKRKYAKEIIAEEI